MLPSKGSERRVPAIWVVSLGEDKGRPANNEDGRGGRVSEERLGSAPYTGIVGFSTTFSKK